MTEAEDKITFNVEYRARGSQAEWSSYASVSEDQAWTDYRSWSKDDTDDEYRVVKHTRTVLEPKRAWEAGKTYQSKSSYQYQSKSLDQYLFTVEFVSPKTGIATGYDEDGDFYRRSPDGISEWEEVA